MGVLSPEYTLDNVTLAYFYPGSVTHCKIEDIPVESSLYRLHKYVSNVIRSQPCVSPRRLTYCNSPRATRCRLLPGNGYISFNGTERVWFNQVKHNVAKVPIFRSNHAKCFGARGERISIRSGQAGGALPLLQLKQASETCKFMLSNDIDSPHSSQTPR